MAAGRIAGTRSSSCRPSWTTGLPGYPVRRPRSGRLPAPRRDHRADRRVCRRDPGSGSPRDQRRAIDGGRHGRQPIPPRDGSRHGPGTGRHRRHRRVPHTEDPSGRLGLRAADPASSMPTTIATRTRSRPAACCWSGPARPASSWPRSCRQAGRDVTLSVGHCGRAPRRYRGQGLLLVAATDRRAGSGAGHAAADRRHAARPAGTVRLQPASVGAWRWPRHEPAPVRRERDPSRRSVRGGRRRASPVRRGPVRQPALHRRVLRPAVPHALGHVRRAGRLRPTARRSRAVRLRAARGDRARPRGEPASRPSCGRRATRPTTAGSTCRSSATSACRARCGA